MLRTLASCLLATMAALAVASCTSANGDEIEASATEGAAPSTRGESPATAGGSSLVDADSAARAGDLAAAEAGFAFDLYGRLKSRDGNVFFSPHSIYTALAMTYTGARGETERQMAQVLGLPEFGMPEDARFTPEYREALAGAFGSMASSLSSEEDAGGHTFAEANALWYQDGHTFLEPFLFLNREGFGARVEALDFAHDAEGARATINGWVEESTRGKIEGLIRRGDLDELVRIVLTNAVYFKGRWDEEFDPAATRDAVFHTRPGDASGDVQAPTMHRRGDYRYASVQSQGVALLELPYVGGGATMLVVLPDAELQGGVSAVEGMLSGEVLAGWDSLMGEREVHVSLPKFEITWGTEDIIPDLEALGIVDLFSDAADLSGMDGTHELYVSKVLHKAFVEVNEEGTEAAAATAVVGRLKASMPLMFEADRPFLFLIRDVGTGTVLFMGRVTDPTS